MPCRTEKFPDIECVLYKDYGVSGAMRMFWVGGVALAISQIGFERSRGTLDFTLGLPYKRGVIFNTKYFFGISILITAQLLSYLLSYALIILYNVDVVFSMSILSGRLSSALWSTRLSWRRAR